MNTVISILLYIWQLPQNIAGLIMRANIMSNGGRKYCSQIKVNGKEKDVWFTYFPPFPGGITLGEYIILGGRFDEDDVRHEYGHVRQSRMLGWLYLIVIGLPSLWHAVWHDKLWLRSREYAHFWTERWAEWLGEVKKK